MSLSITNTNHISQQEIAAIANCNMDTHLIVYKRSAETGSRITTLSKKEVTCWQLFLGYVGLGKLADVRIGLDLMTSYLNRFNWSVGASMPPQSIHHQAYLKACMLANKALYSKQNETLLNNVSSQQMHKNIEFVEYTSNGVQHRYNRELSFKWNPCLQVKHIKALLAIRFPNMQIRTLNEYQQRLNVNSTATPALLYQARISCYGGTLE